MMDRLPLFPLNTVLFPHCPLPLHIFEERYELMISRSVEERAPFGVVLIRAGEEVGGDAEPYSTGTTARIARLQRLDDGRMNLVVVGERRFRIESLDRSEAYLTGEVAYPASEDAAGQEADDGAARVAALFGEQFRLQLCAKGEWQRRLDLPTEPEMLADFVAGQMDIDNALKQDLLEELSVRRRLAAEEELLGDRIRELSERWEATRQKKFAGAALN